MKLCLIIILTSFLSCNGGGTEVRSKDKKVDTIEKRITGSDGRLIAIMHIHQNKLEGLCEWFNGKGKLIASGTFEKGRPVSGSFLNWSLYFPEFVKGNPWQLDLYGKDWVTLFEAGYDSEIPDYSIVLENYVAGVKTR